MLSTKAMMNVFTSVTLTLLLAGTPGASFVSSPTVSRGAVPELRSSVAEETSSSVENLSVGAPTDTDDDSDINDAGPDAWPRPLSPGLMENSLFACDPMVEFWRNFQSDRRWAAGENLREMANIAARFSSLGSEAQSYWIRHAGRSGYFLGNAVLGTLGSRLHERLTADGNREGNDMMSALDSSVATRILLETSLSYEQDYSSIKDGEYREPWDMKLNHRQSSPINILTQTGRFVDEAIGTLARRRRQRDVDKNIWITDPASPSLYPKYYQTAFHYQTDGWMSKRSADVYETSTETLFLGRQDAMQRTSLPPIVQLSKKLKSSKGGPMKVLEVACGTGRFMTFMRDSLPLDTEFTAVDLSPYYLDAARDNDAYWRKTRREEEGRNGNKHEETDLRPLRLIQAQAENLPFEDRSFDAVVCVYLYHELPRTIRAKASSEMARVLKDDGVLVLTDSVQLGDRLGLDERIGNFEAMNEPFYVDYCNDDLPGHFIEEGLKPATKTVCSTTKSLSFTK